MSVVINSNTAATMAANNLAQSSASLQKSLNRLSSGSRIVNPEDDAGGLAVSMKLSATARRQEAVANNIANSTSFLQTQDGVLNVVGKVLSRISELKTMSLDPTKNTSDIANYNAEFTQLQSQLNSLSQETFNGVSLFGSSGLNVGTTESGGGVISVGAINLTGGTTTNFSFTAGTGGTAQVTFSPTGAGTFTVTSGGIFIEGDLNNYAHMDHVGDKATYDGAGGWTFSGTGITAVGSMASGFSSVTLDGSMNTGWLGSATFTTAGNTNTAQVTTASSLGSLSLGTISSAIQDVATNRATNGAQQSRLGFAAEVLTTNKANIEAANSRITDVDVAEESTQLARYNVLTQAGTAMLSQANQSTQIALKLLG
jgi:flagellin-like hook-associated protein FlgL